MNMLSVMVSNRIAPFSAFLFAIISIIASSCTNKGGIVFNKRLSLSESITVLSDSVYLSGHNLCLVSVGEQIVVSDYQQGVFVIDQEGQIIESFAKSGNGPGEVLGCGFLAISETEDVWVYDEGHRSFLSYRDGQLHSIETPPTDLFISNGSRFLVKNDSLYFSAVGNKQLVFIIKGGEIVDRVCPVSKYDNLEMPIHSERHVVKGERSFFVVGLGLPFVEEYSYNGVLLSSFDLMCIPERARVFKEQQSVKPNTYFVSTKDAYFNNGFLYLLSASMTDGYHCNEIIVLETTEQGLHYKGKYRLSNGECYSSICVLDQNKIIALNQQS